MSPNKLKVGVIGCGMVANVGHLPVYHKSPLAEIVAVADPLDSHLKKVKSIYNIPKTYNNPNDLIDDPDIEAISICSPHWAHAKQAIRASENGKHILCEKPLGINLKEVDEVIKAVEKNDTIFQTGTQKRFDLGFQFLKNRIVEEDIGKIFQVSIFWYHSMPDLGEDPNETLIQEAGLWRLTDKRSYGGDLLDHGPHYFDLFRWWFGEVDTVSAQIRRFKKSRVNEDHSIVQLSFKNNDSLGLFERSEAVFGDVFGEEQGRIHGTQGTYYFNVPSEYQKKPMQLKKYWRKSKSSKPIKEKIAFSRDPWEQAYAREIRTFINQVLNRSNEDVGFPAEWIPNIYDGRAALEIVLASYESERRNEKIKLPLEKYKPLKWKNGSTIISE
jgi:predicted dehydrogenase